MSISDEIQATKDYYEERLTAQYRLCESLRKHLEVIEARNTHLQYLVVGLRESAKIYASQICAQASAMYAIKDLIEDSAPKPHGNALSRKVLEIITKLDGEMVAIQTASERDVNGTNETED